MPRCAVVYNPTKVSETFTEELGEQLTSRGWTDTLWLETTAEDPGRGMTAEAVAAKVDRVIGAGGDGTIRVVANGMAESGIPMGLIPAGTGNLLARNLDLPLDQSSAIEAALSESTRAIDLVRYRVDGGEPDHFAVMAGVGVDAVIMDETNPKLKDKIGPAAYFFAAGKALGRLPVEMTITIDGGKPHRRRAMICVIGNVGQLPGNITLIPRASPDDGLLDVYVATPHRLSHWFRVAARLVTRRADNTDQVDLWKGRSVVVQLRERDNFQLDGDVSGDCRRVEAEVNPGALLVCVVPPDSTTSAESTISAEQEEPADPRG